SCHYELLCAFVYPVCLSLFLYNATSTTDIYTLSLHDALPILYQQVYFHPVSRSIEVILSHLLKRAKYLYKNGKTNCLGPTNLLFPFFEGDFSLSDYLKLEDRKSTRLTPVTFRSRMPSSA